MPATGLMPMSEIAGMSGLDYLRGMAEGRYPAPPIAATMGFHGASFDTGLAIFRGTPEAHVLNPMGGVHGGWYGTILDSAMACAVMTRLAVGQAYTTLEYKVNITRAIRQGMEVECRGEVDHFGRTTSVAHGEIRGVEDGKLYATATTTCLIMQVPG
ncbi:thioesterase [Marinibacterium profundimaris]|uniref:Thioesterase n=2 Tax=Marinibacterium profundimaris TaxID=1679460 RepID=A0A225ND56_9RHOB|nr:thioesterase [Marinibacterium profundimaris]